MPNALVAQMLSLAPGQRAAALLTVSEDQWFDRKSVRIAPRDLAAAEAGFANAEGGTIVVGLANGRVEGVDGNSTRLNALMQAAVDFTDPPVRARGRLVECVDEGGQRNHLLVVEVEPSEIVHATARDEVYLRIGDENRRLTFRQRQELLFDKGQAHFDATPVLGLQLTDLDQELVRSYADAFEHPEPERLLRARGLVLGDGRLTAAACLLFGREAQADFPEAYVRVIRHQGTERMTGSRQRVLRDIRCEGPIPVVLGKAAEEIRAAQPARKSLGTRGRFEAQRLIPEDAWLEGLVNAVVHRSYSLSGDHIRVEIFDDRIEFESPGRFPGLVNPTDPWHITRFARNPRIARVCADLDFGQELGEGIRRMFEEMRQAGLADPLYRQTPASVRLTLSAIAVDRELESRLPARSREVLEALRQAGQLSTGDLVDAIGMARPAVIRRLKALEGAGLVEWVGKSPKDPRATWRIKW